MTILAGSCPLVCVGGFDSNSFAIVYQDDNPQLLPRMYLLFHVATGSIVLLTHERYDVEEVPVQGGRAFVLHRFPDNCSCSVYIASNGQDHACDCGEVHSGQAKHLAVENLGQPVSFSNENDIATWVSLFRSRKQKGSSPGEIQVLFSTLHNAEGQVHCQVIDGSYFGGADAGPFIRCLEQVGDAAPVQVVEKVMQLLDRNQIWHLITQLADALLSQPVTGIDQRRQLNRDLIMPILHVIVA